MLAQVLATGLELPTSPRRPQRDDIRTTYHPHTGRSVEVKSFEDYGRDYGRAKPKPSSPRSTMPWLPFHSEAEFSFAEIVLESAMSNPQVDALIQVIHKLLERRGQFVVRNHEELEKLWVGASDELAPVRVTYAATVEYVF